MEARSSLAAFPVVVSLIISCARTSRAFLSQNFASPRMLNARCRYDFSTCFATYEREKWVDDDGDDGRMPYRTRYTGESDEARELGNMRYESDEADSGGLEFAKDEDDDDDYFYDDVVEGEREDGDERYAEEEVVVSRRTTVSEKGEEQAVSGNYWSNPKPGFDPLPSSERQKTPMKRRQRDTTESTSISQRRPRPRPRGATRPQTTFRSGSPSTPEPVADFYDRLFWYGFNSDESIAPGDKTMFGGTKGKFNGLDILQDNDERRRRPSASSSRRRKRPPEQFRADEWYNDIMESIDSESADEEDVGAYAYEDIPISERRRLGSERNLPRRQRTLPPIKEVEVDYEDDERRYQRPQRKPYQKSSRSPSTRRASANDWVSNEVSSWFSDDDTYDDECDRVDNYEYERSRKPRRRASKEEESWSFTKILDGIFGMNREEIAMNAASYNRQMGIDKSERPNRNLGRSRKSSKNAFRYEGEEGSQPRQPARREAGMDWDDVVDVDAVIEDEVDPNTSKKNRERSIDERAAAFERVPPSGVPAWGPNGEVGMDARTKATLDALEDIREATRKVEQKEEECIDAKEQLVVLKVDFELQKKRLMASIEDPRQVRSRLRQMKMGVQDAARDLRQSRAELQVARDRLGELEDRNWALLSLYDADKAFQEVVETFREFEESEGLQTRLDESEPFGAYSVQSVETDRGDDYRTITGEGE